MSESAEVVLAATAVLALVLLAVALSATAGRLDRLHRRVESGVVALDAVLLRRAAAAARLARAGVLDPASAVLLAGAADAAAAAASPAARERAESDLSRLLRAALTEETTGVLARDPDGAAALADLAAACERVVLARRFANDAAVRAQQVHRKRLVRWARLAGRAAVPETVELDDEPPPALAALPSVPQGPRLR